MVVRVLHLNIGFPRGISLMPHVFITHIVIDLQICTRNERTSAVERKFLIRQLTLTKPIRMPIAIPAPEGVSRRSGEDLSSAPGNLPSSPLMVETAKGYDFPELEGKEPQQQVRTEV